MTTEVFRIAADQPSILSDLVRLFGDVFEMSPLTIASKAHLEQVLQDQHFIALAIYKNNELAGGLTAYVLHQYHSEKPLVYLFDLAVAQRYQRQGIGRQLLAALATYAKDMGAAAFFVQADNDDHHALEFYHSTGGNSEAVTHFTYPL